MGCDINEHDQTIIGESAAMDHVHKQAFKERQNWVGYEIYMYENNIIPLFRQ